MVILGTSGIHPLIEKGLKNDALDCVIKFEIRDLILAYCGGSKEKILEFMQECYQRKKEKAEEEAKQAEKVHKRKRRENPYSFAVARHTYM